MPKNIKRAKRDITAQLEARNRIGGHNPISTLSGMSDTPFSVTKEVLSQLEKEGIARVHAHDNGRIDEIIFVRPPVTTDRTEKPGWMKREERYARGIPHYLPDDLCSPVVSRYVDRTTSDAATGHTEPKPESDEVATQEPVEADDRPYNELLTIYLQALRSYADTEGYVADKSVTGVLKEKFPGLTQSKAGYAARHLRGMELLFVEGAGRQRNSYMVDMECTEVTPEMLMDYRTQQREVKLKQDSQVTPPAPEQKEQTAPTPATSATNPLLRLADIVERQEVEISQLREENTGLCGRLAELEAENTGLQGTVKSVTEKLSDAEAALEEYAKQIQSLREQLANQQQIDQRVESILQRHQG